MPAPFRRSCSNCAKSKRRCDLALPRCYRCRVRSLDCRYHHAPIFPAQQQLPSSILNAAGEPDLIASSQDGTSIVDTPADLMMPDQQEASLPSFPDYDLDWPDVMGNIESYWVPDQLTPIYSPSEGVLAGEIYQERIIYSVKRIRAYPSLLVNQGSTPFIHKKLYSEYMPPAIQDILGVCALYGQKNEQNQALVFQIISLKANQLIAGYTPQGFSAVEQLASTQALILYQIMRLFDGDIRQRADAEISHAILNEWTQQLKTRMQRINFASEHEQVLPSLSRDTNWKNWVYAESLRRTVLISFSVQGLYCFLKNGWDDYHHEINRLSFYAQRALWDAPSEYHWRSAIEEYDALPVRFSSWDADMMNAKSSDMEDLGITMMALVKGVDECSEWVGTQNLEKFGLELHGKE